MPTTRSRSPRRLPAVRTSPKLRIWHVCTSHDCSLSDSDGPQLPRRFSAIRSACPELFWCYYFSSFTYSIVGAAMLLHFDLPAVYHAAAPLPMTAYACLLVVQGLLSWSADVWARALRGFSRHPLYLADRVVATAVTVYTLYLGPVCWGAHSTPVQQGIAASALGGLLPFCLSQHTLRRGRLHAFMAWHVAWHLSIPGVAAAWLGHTCDGWFSDTTAQSTTEEVALCSLLVLCSAWVWRRVHYGRLDYCTDASLCGLWTTKLHVALGVLSGALTASDMSRLPALGWGLFALYTVRNLKHWQNMNRVFASVQRASPGVSGSSMTRQQVQLHLGLGLGRLGGSALAAMPPASPWPLRALLAFTATIGFAQLARPPLSEKARAKFVLWQAVYFR